MSTSAAAPFGTEPVAERSIKARNADGAVLVVLALAELAWLLAIAYGLLVFFR